MREAGPTEEGSAPRPDGRPGRVPVAVIGFGPSGAVAAATLGARGIGTLAIDRRREVYDKPRAIAIDHEILRHLDGLGVAERVLPYTAPFPASEHFGAAGQLIRRIDAVPEPFPLGYTPTMTFSQPPVEEALREHARATPGVVVELGTELAGLEQDADGVTLHLRGPDGEPWTATADYVVACDGASSGVRRALGIELDDLVFDEPWLVVDVVVNEAALPRLPKTAAQFCDPARPATYIVGPGRHRRWEIMLLPGEDGRAMEEPEAVWRLLSPWLGPGDGTLWRAASYRFHALVARDWRRGRVLLAGDAAHQQPPFIGQGMCQGLRDVANLAWRLERVLKGRSGPALLDGYGVERSAHVRELTARIKAIGEVVCERDPDAAHARDARLLAEGGGSPRTVTRQEIVPGLTTGLLSDGGGKGRGALFPQPWIVDDGGPPVLMDKRFGAGWRLVLDARDPPPLPPPAVLGELRPIAVGPGAAPERDGVLSDWFDRNGCRAAIVRPDHYVFGTAATGPELDRLTRELRDRLR